MRTSRRFARPVSACLLVAGVIALGSIALGSIAVRSPAANAADTDSPIPPASTTTIAGATTTKAPAPSPTQASSPASAAAAPAGADFMATGRAAVAKSDWKAAIAQFTSAVGANPKDADANNMLAYSYRKSGDLANAFRYYKIALTIDPKHKGALEYQGEAFVMAGKMTDAKANLAKLKSLGCATTCENYKDLAAFIAKPPKKKK